MTNFNILPSTPRSCELSLFLRFTHQNPVWILFLPLMLHATTVLSSLIWPPKNIWWGYISWSSKLHSVLQPHYIPPSLFQVSSTATHCYQFHTVGIETGTIHSLVSWSSPVLQFTVHGVCIVPWRFQMVSCQIHLQVPQQFTDQTHGLSHWLWSETCMISSCYRQIAVWIINIVLHDW